MTSSRALTVLIFSLLLTTLWSPSSIDGSVNVMDYLRYAVFGTLSLLILAVAYVHSRRNATRLLLPSGPALIALFILYCIASVFWSEGSTSSIIKAVLLALALVTGLAAAASKTNGELIRLVVASCAVVLVVGFAVSLLIPAIGIETGWQLEGKWRGISGQKNEFGALAAIALVGTYVLLRGPDPAHPQRRVLLRVLGLGFFTVCLLLSGSRGGQLIALVGFAAVMFTRLSRNLQNVTLFGAAVVALPFVAFAAMTFTAEDTHLSFAGLSFDTSNRTEIWAYGLENLRGRELFGVGLASFWTPDRVEVFKANHGWVLDNFHNGYMTVLIEEGLLGLSLFLLGMIMSFSMLRRMTADANKYAVFSFAYLNMVMVHNLVENTLGRSTNFMFICFLFVLFSGFRGSFSAVLSRDARRTSQIKTV